MGNQNGYFNSVDYLCCFLKYFLMLYVPPEMEFNLFAMVVRMNADFTLSKQTSQTRGVFVFACILWNKGLKLFVKLLILSLLDLMRRLALYPVVYRYTSAVVLYPSFLRVSPTNSYPMIGEAVWVMGYVYMSFRHTFLIIQANCS